jgi:hypothetical protein
VLRIACSVKKEMKMRANIVRSGFEDRSRGDEAESLEFSGKSASSRRRLRTELNFEADSSESEVRV